MARERSKDEIPFREMTAAQKRSYLWDYWRIPALVVIVVAAVLISLIHTMVSTKDALLSVTTVDAGDDTSFTVYVDEFAKRHGIPEDEYVVGDATVGTSAMGGGAQSQQGMALYVRLQAGSEDIVILREETFYDYAAGGYFLDLSEVVPGEWQDKLVVVRQRYDEYDEVQPEPVACGIRMRDIPGMPDTPFYRDAVLAVSYLPDNYDNALAFLCELLGEA